MESNYIFKFGYNYFLIIVVLIITNYRIISIISYKNNNNILLLLFVNLLIIIIVVFFKLSKTNQNNTLNGISYKDYNVNDIYIEFEKIQNNMINKKNKLINIGIIPDGNRRWCKNNNVEYNYLLDHWHNEMIINSIYTILRKKNVMNELTNLKYVKSLSLYISSIDNINRKDGSENLGFDLIKKVCPKNIR